MERRGWVLEEIEIIIFSLPGDANVVYADDDGIADRKWFFQAAAVQPAADPCVRDEGDVIIPVGVAVDLAPQDRFFFNIAFFCRRDRLNAAADV